MGSAPDRTFLGLSGNKRFSLADRLVTLAKARVGSRNHKAEWAFAVLNARPRLRDYGLRVDYEEGQSAYLSIVDAGLRRP